MYSSAASTINTFTASGFCSRCNCVHSLSQGTSSQDSLALIQRLDKQQSLDLNNTGALDKKDLSTLPLWGEARGKMFGVLNCLSRNKKPVTLYAFSGQFNGKWHIEGWAPPLFDVSTFHEITFHKEKEIKSITREIATTQTHSEQWLRLRKERRTLSQSLMKEIHALYRLNNFRGEKKSLDEVFHGEKKIPTGTGDCCAPKLLNYAAIHNLHPIGISEFFYGRQTKSGSYNHGIFSSSCKEKCAPILGFMLCGVENKKSE